MSPVPTISECHHAVAPSVLLRLPLYIVAEHVSDYSTPSFLVANLLSMIEKPYQLTTIKVLTTKNSPTTTVEPKVPAKIEVVSHRISNETITIAYNVNPRHIVDTPSLDRTIEHTVDSIMPQVGHRVEMGWSMFEV